MEKPCGETEITDVSSACEAEIDRESRSQAGVGGGGRRDEEGELGAERKMLATWREMDRGREREEKGARFGGRSERIASFSPTRPDSDLALPSRHANSTTAG